MTFNGEEFAELRHRAADTIMFDEVREELQAALNVINAAADIVPFQRTVFVSRCEEALARLESRQTDPVQLLGTLNHYLAKDKIATTDQAALDLWFAKVAYAPGQTVNDDLMGKMCQIRRRDEQYDLPSHLKKLEDRLNNYETFAQSSVDLDQTANNVTGLERVLRSMPLEESSFAPLWGRIAAIRTLLAERRTQPLETLIGEALTNYGRTVAAAPEGRLGQQISKELHSNLRESKKIVGAGELEESVRAGFLNRLEEIEDAFDKARFRSPTTVYKQTYEPRLAEVRVEADQTLDFAGIDRALEELSQQSRRGKQGVDSLGKYHQGLVATGVQEVRQILSARFQDVEALQRETRRLLEELRALKDRPLLTQRSITRIQQDITACEQWAQKTLPSQERQLAELRNLAQIWKLGAPALAEQAPSLAALADALNELSSSIQALLKSNSSLDLSQQEGFRRQGSHVRRLLCLEFFQIFRGECEVLKGLVQGCYQAYLDTYADSFRRIIHDIGSTDDLQSTLVEIEELQRSIEDSESSLHAQDRQGLQGALNRTWQTFHRRLNDAADVRQNISRLSDLLREAERQPLRIAEPEALESEVRKLAFHAQRGQFTVADRRDFGMAVAGMLGQIRALRRKREQYLARRAANQAALYTELQASIAECCERAEREPGNPNAWEGLIEADRQLQQARILQSDQKENLRKQLDGGFTRIKEERARFAQRASMIYADYLDAIQNIQQALERTNPPPTRSDAFEAIEAVKPLRVRLRTEDGLLRRHRQELAESLRIVSDSISEVLDRASEQMQRNFVTIRNRVEQLTDDVQHVLSPDQLQVVISSHRALYDAIRETELPIDGRRQCRSLMEAAWNVIAEKQREFGRSRFEASNIDATLSRLEKLGYFSWRVGVPRIA